MTKESVNRLMAYLKVNFFCHECGEKFHPEEFKIIGMGPSTVDSIYICPKCLFNHSAVINENSFPTSSQTNSVSYGTPTPLTHDWYPREIPTDSPAITADEVLGVREFVKKLNSDSLSRIWPESYIEVKALPKSPLG